MWREFPRVYMLVSWHPGDSPMLRVDLFKCRLELGFQPGLEKADLEKSGSRSDKLAISNPEAWPDNKW